MTLAILYQDSDLVAMSKDAGEPVIPTGGGPRDACLHRRLEAQIGARLRIVHRLDREASGLVIFARSAEAHRALSMAFEHREVEKHYVAFATGAPAADAGQLDVALHDARRLVLPRGLLLEAPLAPDLVALGRWLNASWSVEPLSS